MMRGRDESLMGMARRNQQQFYSQPPAAISPIGQDEELDILEDTTASLTADTTAPQLDFAIEQEQPLDINAWASSFNAAREANKNAIGTDVLAEEGRYYRGTQGGAQLGLGSDDYKKTWNEGVDFVANNISEFIYQDDNGKLVLDTKGTDIDLILAGLGKFDPELPNKLIKDQDFKLQDKDKGIYHVVNSRNFVDTIGDVAPMLLLTTLGAPALAGALGTSTATASALINAGNAVAQGGDIKDIAKAAALSYAGGQIGDRIATGLEYGVNPFGEQAGMLASQTGNMTGAYGFLPEAAGGTASRLVQGDSLEKALLGGVVQGAKEGYLPETPEGSFDLGLPRINLGKYIDTPDALRDFDRNVLQPAKDVIKETGRDFDYGVLQPTKDVIADAGQTVYDEIIQPAGQFIDDNIIDPIDQVIRDIPNPELPDVDLPDIDLPDIDLPNINWGNLFGGLISGGMLLGGMGNMGGGGAPSNQKAIQTELQDSKFLNPYRSKIRQNIRG